MRNKRLPSTALPQKGYIIVCNHLGEVFSSKEKALEAAAQLSRSTGLDEKKFDVIAIQYAEPQ